MTPNPLRSSIYLALIVLLSLCTTGCGGEESSQCEAGSEGCECAPGGQCLSGLSCLSSVCVSSGSDVSPDGSVDLTSDGDMSSNDMPPSDVPSNDMSPMDTDMTSIPDTTADMPVDLTADCPYPDSSATASLNESLTETAAASLAMVFNNNGAMVSLDGQACVAGDDTGFMSRTQTDCFDTYLCGNCPMVIGSRTLEGVLDFYLAPFDIPVPEGCETFGGFYSVASGD